MAPKTSTFFDLKTCLGKSYRHSGHDRRQELEHSGIILYTLSGVCRVFQFNAIDVVEKIQGATKSEQIRLAEPHACWLESVNAPRHFVDNHFFATIASFSHCCMNDLLVVSRLCSMRLMPFAYILLGLAPTMANQVTKDKP